jgi:hypothetical protein
VKKDWTKDLHPSIKNMIKKALVTEQDRELCEKILSLYNSKRMGGLISNCTNFLTTSEWGM